MTQKNDTVLTEAQKTQLRAIAQQFSDLLAETNFDQQGQILRAVQSQLAHGFYLRDIHETLQLARFALCDYDRAMRVPIEGDLLTRVNTYISTNPLWHLQSREKIMSDLGISKPTTSEVEEWLKTQ